MACTAVVTGDSSSSSSAGWITSCSSQKLFGFWQTTKNNMYHNTYTGVHGAQRPHNTRNFRKIQKMWVCRGVLLAEHENCVDYHTAVLPQRGKQKYCSTTPTPQRTVCTRKRGCETIDHQTKQPVREGACCRLLTQGRKCCGGKLRCNGRCYTAVLVLLMRK